MPVFLFPPVAPGKSAIAFQGNDVLDLVWPSLLTHCTLTQVYEARLAALLAARNDRQDEHKRAQERYKKVTAGCVLYPNQISLKSDFFFCTCRYTSSRRQLTGAFLLLRTTPIHPPVRIVRNSTRKLRNSEARKRKEWRSAWVSFGVSRTATDRDTATQNR